MLLLYTYVSQCFEVMDAIQKEGYKCENFQIVCKNGKEAIEAFEKNIKKNKKLNKSGTYYVYVTNAYEYAKYWEDTHFVFDYYVGDIKVIEGKVFPEKPFDDDDFCMVEYKDSFDSKYICEYDPIPEEVLKTIMERMDRLESNPEDTISLDTPYDHIEKADEVAANIQSSLDGGDFKPISIKMTDEAVKRFEEHDNCFHKSGFWALQAYLSKKNKNNDTCEECGEKKDTKIGAWCKKCGRINS